MTRGKDIGHKYDWPRLDIRPVSPAERAAARVTLAAHARDATELQQWLRMLDLTPDKEDQP